MHPNVKGMPSILENDQSRARNLLNSGGMFMRRSNRNIGGLVLAATLVIVLILSSCTLAATKITLWHPISWWHETFKQAAQNFNEQCPENELKVELFPGGWGGIRDKVILAAAGGVEDPPTIVVTHVDHNWMLEEMGLFAPVPETLLAETQLAERFLFYDRIYQYKGKYTRIPFAVMNGMLFYNRKLLSEGGIDPDAIPTSWTAFQAIASKLTRRDSEGKITQSGFDLRHDPAVLWIDLIYQQAQYLYTKEGYAQFDSREGIRAAELLIDLSRYHGPWGGPGKMTGFANDAVATMCAWGWVSAWLKDNAPDVDYGVCPAPTISGAMHPAYGRMNSEEGFMVLSTSPAEKQKAAWEFIRFVLLKPDILMDLALTIGGIPVDRTLWVEPRIQENPVLATMATTMPYSVFTGEINTAYDILHKHVSSIVKEEKDPGSALKTATKEFNATVEKRVPRTIERHFPFQQ